MKNRLARIALLCTAMLLSGCTATIPLLQTWLADGMFVGSTAAFMITEPATKITNLGAVKIVLGIKCFILYIAFVMIFSLITGLFVNFIF